MRTIKFLSVLCILLITSCTSDDGTSIDTNAQKDDLVGTWNLSEITQEGTTTTNIEGIPITIDFSTLGKDIDAQVIFSENPDNFIGSGSYTSVITYTIIGQSTTQETQVNLNDFLNTGTWKLSEGILTVTQNNESQTAEITELTANTLKFEIELNEVITLDGFTTTANTRAKMTLTK